MRKYLNQQDVLRDLANYGVYSQRESILVPALGAIKS